MSYNIDFVVKRNRTLVPFDPKKITDAICKAGAEPLDAEKVTKKVLKKLKLWNSQQPHVDQIHTMVENALMDSKLHDVAREYITYRDANKPDIFRKRLEVEPLEYPHLLQYKLAIRNSYWLETHYSYDADVQDMKVTLTPEERSVATKAMLAISQIENAVKTFWARLDTKLPKPEISSVGATFAESEVRHEDAYKKLLELMHLKDEFKELNKVPCIAKRVKYLDKVNSNMRSVDNRDFFECIILFSIFVENVSLFSQFIILMSFRKHKNMLKGISNAVEATSKEEIIHAEFGFELVNIIRDENPSWFDEDLTDRLYEISREAYEAECSVVDWIYSEGNLDFIPKEVVQEYIKFRLDESLKKLGVEPIFNANLELISELEWFDDELTTTKRVDFFNTRDPQYTIGTKSITADDLF